MNLFLQKAIRASTWIVLISKLIWYSTASVFHHDGIDRRRMKVSKPRVINLQLYIRKLTIWLIVRKYQYYTGITTNDNILMEELSQWQKPVSTVCCDQTWHFSPPFLCEEWWKDYILLIIFIQLPIWSLIFICNNSNGKPTWPPGSQEGPQAVMYGPQSFSG